MGEHRIVYVKAESLDLLENRTLSRRRRHVIPVAPRPIGSLENPMAQESASGFVCFPPLATVQACST
jgi:hypothetical protein